MELFTVITADIIDSRRQEALVAEKKQGLTGLILPELVTPFTFSRGDEVQAVCTGYLRAPSLLRQLRYYFLPLKLRIGIGLGTITSGLEAESSWQMNGPAFHHARQALDQMKYERYSLTKLVSGDHQFDQAVNAFLALYDTILGRWTREQWEGVMTYEAAGTYREAAARLGIALQNVEKRCRAAHWRVIQQAEAALKLMPERILPITKSPVINE
ncbi:MAG: hypothetical protein GX050_06145 [Firmicutes bacterium]|nr:hypothetical protein [Bacillota bacterium]